MSLCDRMLIAFLMLGSTLVWTRASGQGFNRRYDLLGQNNWQAGFGIEVAAGGFMIIGNTAAFTNDGGYYEPIVFSILLDSDGVPFDSDTLVVTDHALYPGAWNCMNRRAAGGYISGGSSFSQTETQRFALYKVAGDGEIQFVEQYGAEGEESIGRQAMECKDGGFLMVGETSEFGVIDGMLLKTDSAGVVEWERSYGEPLWRDYLSSVDTTLDDGYFTGGSYRIGEENLQQWVQRINSVGDTIWTRLWGSEYNDSPARVTTKTNGNVLTASAWNYAPNSSASQAYMAELDQNSGVFIWENWYGPILNYTTLRVAKEISPGGGHIAVGMAFAENTNFFLGIMLRTADNGDSLWLRRYFYYDSLMTDGIGELNDVLPTLDGGFIACGFTMGPYAGPYPPGYSDDLWVVKVDSLGCIVPGCDDFSTVITVQATNLKDALAVFPNPARESTTVKVTLPASSPFIESLRLRLVNAQGQEVLMQKAVLAENNLSVEGEAAGLYYIHLTSGTTWLSGTKLIIE